MPTSAFNYIINLQNRYFSSYVLQLPITDNSSEEVKALTYHDR